MSVAVAWVSYHEPHIIRRGYWDQGLLERVIDRSLWRPAAALDYCHYAGVDKVPDGEGAVVVVPGQHHTSADDVARLNAELARLPWAVVVLTGDECSHFPWRELAHPAMRLWVMTPQPGVHDDCPARFVGEGWRYDTPDVLATFAAEASEKAQDWFFAGQVTHRRREMMAGALRRMGPAAGHLVETPGFTQGLDRAQYLRGLAGAKVAPCPAGACTPDSFRLYEALEAGCLPLLDDTSPQGWSGFWSLMGEARPPAPVVTEWRQVGLTIGEVLRCWPANANRAFAWWQQYKRTIAYALDDDVRQVGGGAEPVAATPNDLADLVTVLVPTSPIPSHPSTAIIEQTLASVVERLPGCEVFVMADGVRPEQEDRRDDYERYLRQLLHLTNRTAAVVPFVHDEHLHQAEMTRRALELVRTPLVLFVEHDTPLVGDVPFDALARVVLSGTADAIRLHHEAAVLDEHRYLMADLEPVDVDGVSLQRTGQWSQRPHLARASWYRWLLDGHLFGPGTRTMIEDRLYGEIATPWVERHQWGGWCKLWMFTPEGDVKRSTHLDGRAGDPKFEMTW